MISLAGMDAGINTSSDKSEEEPRVRVYYAGVNLNGVPYGNSYLTHVESTMIADLYPATLVNLITAQASCVRWIPFYGAIFRLTYFALWSRAAIERPSLTGRAQANSFTTLAAMCSGRPSESTAKRWSVFTSTHGSMI